MAAMWEVVILHALSLQSAVATEEPLASGRRPDVRFDDGRIGFTADITCVSDEGLDEANPNHELSQEIEPPRPGSACRLAGRTHASVPGRRR